MQMEIVNIAISTIKTNMERWKYEHYEGERNYYNDLMEKFEGKEVAYAERN